MSGEIKINESWKSVNKSFIKIDSTWKNVMKSYVKINGLWKEVHNENPTDPSTDGLIYGIKIDEAVADPNLAVTYTDDAVDMEGGSSEWDNLFPFNLIRPVLFAKNHSPIELQKNDYTKRLSGSSADITTNTSIYDVMIEFPKLYWKFEKIDSCIYIKYSNIQIDESYKCLAHTRGVEERDNVYIGAYLGYSYSNRLRSLSGKTPTRNQTMSAFRTLARAGGDGYEQIGYYQLLMLQILFVMRFKSLNSQDVLGKGNSSGGSIKTTGATNTKGFYYGETTGKQQMKFCGIEDLWGNLSQFLEGIYIGTDYNMYLGNDNFGSYITTNYENFGSSTSENITGIIAGIQGDTNTGFIPKTTITGNYNKHYCCTGSILSTNNNVRFGGSYEDSMTSGIFYFAANILNSSGQSYIGTRLMYL